MQLLVYKHNSLLQLFVAEVESLRSQLRENQYKPHASSWLGL
ncbi:hypothetical protein [Nostoc sp. DedQUE07]|nr:hypothetical protein [Nostoc sp. DedQUE07]MDZ8132451.1 hypothetical protein [Nostoc sp. DedQUE07]